MLRILFWLAFLFVLYLLVRERIRRKLRRMRGLPDPEPQGPKTVTLAVIAIALVYGLLISYRLYTEGLGALH